MIKQAWRERQTIVSKLGSCVQHEVESENLGAKRSTQQLAPQSFIFRVSVQTTGYHWRGERERDQGGREESYSWKTRKKNILERGSGAERWKKPMKWNKDRAVWQKVWSTGKMKTGYIRGRMMKKRKGAGKGWRRASLTWRRTDFKNHGNVGWIRGKEESRREDRVMRKEREKLSETFWGLWPARGSRNSNKLFTAQMFLHQDKINHKINQSQQSSTVTRADSALKYSEQRAQAAVH